MSTIFADLGQRHAEPLAPQDQLEPRTVAGVVDAISRRTVRRDQPFGLVEAQGARGDAEVVGELATVQIRTSLVVVIGLS